MVADLKEYFFRTTIGDTPFTPGNFMVEQKGLSSNYKLKDTDRIYFTPALYSRAKKVFNDGVRIFAIRRPALDPKKTMACGVNSAYHFVRRDESEQVVKLMEEAIISKDYSNPTVRLILKNHKNSKHWTRKGGQYLATLAEYDKLQPTDAYPEVSFLLKDVKHQEWEELVFDSRTKLFIGTKSKKQFIPECEISLEAIDQNTGRVSTESYSETATEISGKYNEWFGEYMYHGSSVRLSTLEPQIRNNRTTSSTKPKIFFTPFKGFAGFFCIDQNNDLLSVFGDQYNKETIKVLPKEMPAKDKDGNYDLAQFQQVNTNITFKHNVREFKTKFTKRFVGYIHFVNTEKLIASGLQEHVFSGIPEYWYYKPVHVDKVEKVEIVATFEYDQSFANKVGQAIMVPEIATEALSESLNVTGEFMNDFAIEGMQLLSSSPEELELTKLAKPLYNSKGRNSWEHIQQDVYNGVEIIRALKHRSLTLKEYASILFHDCSVKSHPEKIKHSQVSADIAKPILEDCGIFTSSDVKEICTAIIEHDIDMNPDQVWTSDLSDLLASADFNPPNIAWILNKVYIWGIRHGLSYEERFEEMMRHVPKVYGSKGLAVYPKFYSLYHKDKIRKMQQFFDKMTIEDAKEIVEDYRKRLHLKQDDESLPDPAIESFDVSEKSMDEFASETMQDTVSAKKMYFSTTDGKLPLDDKGNALFCKNLDDARIDAAMITYQKKMHKNCCCEGYVPRMKHVLLVHTDESHKEEQNFDVKGSVYSVTFKEPVKAKFYASFGYKKCKIPKWYLVEKDNIKDYKIEKEEDVDLQATCRYVEKFEATESFSQENLGSKDDAFVRDIIRPKIRDGILYHGSANKHVPIKAFQLKELRDKKIKTISLTPYKRLASLFCVPFRSIRENEKGQVIYHHAAFKLDEWFEDIPEDDKYKAVQTVHISHNIKELAPTDKVYTGYLHYVDAEDALEDAGRNPINDKGPNEVVCFKSELKPFKVEQIHVRMISRYSPSFAKEVGHDAESCEPEDIASEEFNPKFSETNVEDISMEEGIELLSEFNEGCKAFEHWVNQLEASYIYKTTDDKGVKQVCYSVAQENILTDTIKEIFKKIGEFIHWFWSKLVQLWNFFFGRVQRAQRTFKANCDKIKQHKNSNKYFNENAFKAMKAPYGICIDSMFADLIELGGWVPDKIYETIELVYTNYEKDMEKLMDLLKDNNQSNPLYVLFTATGFGGKATNADDAKMTMYDMLVKEYPANGTLGDAEYDQEAVLDYNALMEAINTSYDKISKFIKSKGDISYSAAKRVLDYGDRVDLSQQEANELAKKVQYISASIRLMVEKYNRSYEQILNHVIKLQECYKKCMQ